MTKWNIREEDYGNHILTDDIEIVIIELPKVEKYKKGLALDHWVEFIKNPKVINMSNKEIKKAKDVLEQISQDGTERHLAELRLKHIRDQKAIEAAGFDKGFEKGMEKGNSTTKIQIAKKMKSQGFDLDTIHKLTELPIEEIKKL